VGTGFWIRRFIGIPIVYLGKKIGEVVEWTSGKEHDKRAGEKQGIAGA